MFNIFTIVLGSATIGYGLGSWYVGIGLLVILFGFHRHINVSLVIVHQSLIESMQVLYNNIEKKR